MQPVAALNGVAKVHVHCIVYLMSATGRHYLNADTELPLRPAKHLRSFNSLEISALVIPPPIRNASHPPARLHTRMCKLHVTLTGE